MKSLTKPVHFSMVRHPKKCEPLIKMSTKGFTKVNLVDRFTTNISHMSLCYTSKYLTSEVLYLSGVSIVVVTIKCRKCYTFIVMVFFIIVEHLHLSE